jgi:F-type H+-transporting ATPase subunit delta
VKAAVGQNWSTTSDLLNSLVLLGRESLLKAAADQGQLDGVEDELFRLGRIVAGDPTLEQALSDRSVSAKAKRDLLSKLLYGKVTAVTEALAVQAVGRLKSTAPADAFDALANLAAARREAVVAKVRSASTLSSEQTDRLAAALTRTYGKPVTVHVEVDPELLSGLVVRVGDEVIDGSAAGRLAALRKSLK